MRISVCFLCVAVFSLARADVATDARVHFDAGNARYAVGEFAEAAEEYQAAFKLKQDPALLFNAAQAYRLAGNHEKALLLYRNYLILFPNQKNTSVVKAQITKLSEVVAASQKARTAPPQETEEKTSLPAAAPAPAPAAPAVVVAAAEPEKKTPLYKKWWLWTAVGVVVAGGVIAGAVVATRPAPSWTNVPDFGPGAR